MKIKEGVNIWGLQVEMQKVLKQAAKIWKKYGEELVITSARDGIHSPGSLHYFGYAVDLRTYYFTKPTINLIAAELQDRIGWKYQVIVEKTHIHVEYDNILRK